MTQATNLILLGDSNTKGIVNNDSRLIVTENPAANIISRHFNFNLNNMSYFGQTLKKAHERGLLNKILSALDSNARNLVVINLGSNDADYNWHEVNSRGGLNHSPRTQPKEFETFYRIFLKDLRDAGCDVRICSLLPLVSEKYFDSTLVNLCSPDKILNLLDGNKNNLIVHQEIFNNIIEDVSHKEKVPVINLRKMMLSTPNWQNYYCEDGIHLTEAGQELIAGKIINAYNA